MDAVTVISTNLLRLRKVRNLTQETLAEAAGLSRGAYRSIEKGRSEPRSQTLRALAEALDVPLRELVSPVRRLEHVRFRSLKRLKRRDQVLADVGRWLQDFEELEDLLDARKPHSLGELAEQIPRSGRRDLAEIAAQTRAHFGLSQREPVFDICGLLESEGIKVFAVNVASDAFLGLSVAEADGGPAVVANTWERLPVELWIYSAAHELGHLLLHLNAYDVDVEKEDERQEKEANVFASHFLMPEEIFRREWNETAGLSLLDRVLKVKRLFRVSWRTVLYRVAESRPAKQRAALWQQINAEYKAKTRRSLRKLDEPHGVDAEYFRDPGVDPASHEPAKLEEHDFQIDRLSRLVRRAVENDVITLARGAEVLGISLQAMRELSASWVA